MDHGQYRELWRIRFKKMLRLEEQAVSDYESLLEECTAKHHEHPIEPLLERLIQDEKRHARLVRELLDILEGQ